MAAENKGAGVPAGRRTPRQDTSPGPGRAQQPKGFVPVDPQPSQWRSAQKAEPVFSVPKVTPLDPKADKRKGTLLVVVLALGGALCGVLLQPVYASLPIRDSFDSVDVLMIFMTLSGLGEGALLALPFLKVYRRATDPLPFYGLLLLLPLLNFTLSGAVLVVWNGFLNLLRIVVVVGLLYLIYRVAKFFMDL